MAIDPKAMHYETATPINEPTTPASMMNTITMPTMNMASGSPNLMPTSLSEPTLATNANPNPTSNPNTVSGNLDSLSSSQMLNMEISPISLNGQVLDQSISTLWIGPGTNNNNISNNNNNNGTSSAGLEESGMTAMTSDNNSNFTDMSSLWMQEVDNLNDLNDLIDSDQSDCML